MRYRAEVSFLALVVTKAMYLKGISPDVTEIVVISVVGACHVDHSRNDHQADSRPFSLDIAT